MASTHKHIRSSTANKRPTTAIADGQIALNTNSASPGLFFKDSTGATIIKIGPVHVGATAPNASPAAGGSAGNSTGEIWLDNSLTPVGVKIWNGSAWVNATPIGSTTVQGLLELATDAETQAGSDNARAVTPASLQSKVSDSTSTTSSTTIASSTAVKAAYDLANAALPKTGGTITGNLEIGTTGSLSFEGSTADGFETTIAVVDPTADRTITLPNTTGTVVTTGDTGTVTSTMLADGTIVDADINSAAAIAHSKLASLTSANILLGNASNVATSTAVTGDVTISNTGVTAIASGVIVDADINASAAIADTKLATISTAGKVNGTALTGTIPSAVLGNSSTFVGTTSIALNRSSANQALTGISSVALPGSTSGTVTVQPTAIAGTTTITLPATTGTVVTTGDSGTVTSTMIADGTIVNGDINASAAIAGTKISPDFGSQTVQTTGIFSHALGTAAAPTVTFTGDTNTGIYSPGADQVAISTNGSGRLFVDSSGNVGAGTSSPAFAAGGGIQAKYATFSSFRATVGANTGTDFSAAADGKGYVYVRDNADLLIGTNNTERLRITSAGLVGVGTSSPGNPLTVVGAASNIALAYLNATDLNDGNGLLIRAGGANSGKYIASMQDGAGNTRLHVLANGSVGVGTTSPGYPLHISSALDASLYIEEPGNNTVRLKAGTSASFIGTTSNHPFYFTTNNQERVRITSAGLVGIGTSTPGALLDISGSGNIVRLGDGTNTFDVRFKGPNNWSTQLDTSADKFNIQRNSTSFVTIDGAGRLGIGTTAVTNLLHLRSDSSSNVDHLYLQNRNGGANSGARIAFSNGTVDYSDNRYAYIGAINTGATESGNHLVFATNANGAAATEKARLDSSGRWLVGTPTSRDKWFNNAAWGNPAFQLETAVSVTSVASIVNNANDDGPGALFLAKSRAGSIGGVTVVNNNDVIGRISFQGADGAEMVAAAQIEAFVDGPPGANDMPGRLVFSTTADGASSPTERMRITNNGNVGIGITNPTGSYADGNGCQISPVGVLQVNRTSNPSGSFGRNTTTGDVVTFAYGSTATNPVQVGSISVTASATAYNTSSDYRLKENVIAVTDGITRLQQLKPSRFNFIADPDSTVDGFIAHEVQEVVPEAIIGEKDAVDDDGNPVYQGIDQSKLVPLLTAALQEAIGEIESLKARVAALESA